MLTDSQKRMMALMLQKPQTAESLAAALQMAYGPVMDDLKVLMSQKLVEKEGYPTQYHLVNLVHQKVEKRRELSSKDPFHLRLRAVIEVQGMEETLVSKGLAELEHELRHQPDRFTVYECIAAKPQLEGELYTAFLDVEFSIKDFKNIVYLMFNYGPVSVEVIKPDQIELSAFDLQDALTDFSEFVHRYTTYIMQNMKRDEIERMNRSFFTKRPSGP